MIDTVDSAKAFLYSFVNYEAKMPRTYNTNYFNMMQFRKLLKIIGNPHEQFPSIHIAGTKGKGSTATIISSILKHAGYITGLYGSPHLRDTRERIQLNGNWISEKQFIAICDYLSIKVKQFKDLPNCYRTTFELLTALAFKYFQLENADVAVVETGLGGRLDSTNILSPILTIITRIGKDHTHLLGNRVTSIAEEKAGIVKKSIPVVVGRQHYRAMKVIGNFAKKKNSSIFIASKHVRVKPHKMSGNGTWFTINSGKWAGEYFLNLAGCHQVDNLEIVFTAIDQLSRVFPRITPESVKKGLEQVELPGRFQVIREKGLPLLLLDGAHNPMSVNQMVKSIKKILEFNRATCILAFSKEKNVSGITKILSSIFPRVIATTTSTQRNIPANELAHLLREVFPSVKVSETPEQALNLAFKQSSETDLVCVTGSFYLVGEILSILDKKGVTREPSSHPGL